MANFKTSCISALAGSEKTPHVARVAGVAELVDALDLGSSVF